MSTDNAWLEALDEDSQEIERLIYERDQARSIAIALEADYAALRDITQRVVSHYIATNIHFVCPDPTTCHCPLGRLLQHLHNYEHDDDSR